MRVVAAAGAGLAVAVACAVVLGDYPLTGAVPWVTPVLVPLLVGGAMALVAGRQASYRHARWTWIAAGPMSAGSILWGVRIATGWGIDPFPASWWAVIAASLLWPTAWGLLGADRRLRTGKPG